MNKHSATPWREETAGHLKQTSRLVVAADGVGIAIFSRAGNAKKPVEQLDADVALAIAAPELLKALRMIVGYEDDHGTLETEDGIGLVDYARGLLGELDEKGTKSEAAWKKEKALRNAVLNRAAEILGEGRVTPYKVRP